MRNKFKLSAKKLKNKDGKEVIEYSCVECGKKQKHYWFGREVHHCIDCGKSTDIKGFE